MKCPNCDGKGVDPKFQGSAWPFPCKICKGAGETAHGVMAPDAVRRNLRELRNYLKASDLGGIKDEWIAALDSLGVPPSSADQPKGGA